MLEQIIENNRNSQTTLTTLLAVLTHYIECIGDQMDYDGLLINEIKRRYDLLATEYGVNNKFYGTYVERRTRQDDLFEERNRRYYMRRLLVADKTPEQLENYCNQIINALRQNNQNLTDLFVDLENVINQNSPQVYLNYIRNLFENNQFRNYGQLFEVLSFSILKVYFESFGFGLKRFSVSYANDGGMDFISANGIYQVTAMPTKNKISGDLNKLPGTSRVMVLTECSDQLYKMTVSNHFVTEVISRQDLKSHFLEWLYNKDLIVPRHLKSILITFKNEISRESNV